MDISALGIQFISKNNIRYLIDFTKAKFNTLPYMHVDNIYVTVMLDGKNITTCLKHSEEFPLIPASIIKKAMLMVAFQGMNKTQEMLLDSIELEKLVWQSVQNANNASDITALKESALYSLL